LKVHLYNNICQHVTLLLKKGTPIVAKKSLVVAIRKQPSKYEHTKFVEQGECLELQSKILALEKLTNV